HAMRYPKEGQILKYMWRVPWHWIRNHKLATGTLAGMSKVQDAVLVHVENLFDYPSSGARVWIYDNLRAVVMLSPTNIEYTIVGANGLNDKVVLWKS
ncbi:hypothetical protein MPER_01910, partial [Moniliophthora perniciosa FA553]